MIKISASAVIAAVCIVLPAGAQERKPVDPDRKICRAVDTTGTLLRGRSECHTASEWRRIQDAHERDMIDMRNRRDNQSQ